MYRHLSFVFAAVIFAAISFVAYPANAHHNSGHSGGPGGTGEVTPTSTRTLIVSPAGDGSDATANGAELRSAIVELQSVVPAPSSSNPWLIKVEPGNYDLHPGTIHMIPFVDIEGSGQGITTIRGSCHCDGLIRVADNTELRDLTVIMDDSRGPGNFFAAIGIGGDTTDTQNWRITNVTAKAINGTDFSYGIYAGQHDCDGGEMTNVTASGSGATRNVGMQLTCNAGSVKATNLVAKGFGGSEAVGLFWCCSGPLTLTVSNSLFEGTTWSIASGPFVKVISSELIGPPGGALICVGSYDETGTALSNGELGAGGCI